MPRPRDATAGPAGGPGTGLGGRIAARLRVRFRLPGRQDPAPHPAKLIGICGWAAGLGLLGLPVAGRSSVAIVMHAAPAWFEPAVVTLGLLGIGLTVAGFAAVHRRWLPWGLLLAASALLASNLLLTLTL